MQIWEFEDNSVEGVGGIALIHAEISGAMTDGVTFAVPISRESRHSYGDVYTGSGIGFGFRRGIQEGAIAQDVDGGKRFRSGVARGRIR